jgi:hypothetical protein
MALTAQQLDDGAREIGRRIFVSPNVTAHSNYTELRSALESIDTGMNSTTDQAATNYPGVNLEVAFLNFARIGAPNLTASEGRYVLNVWTELELGLL